MWSILHVIYPSPAARHRLITQDLPFPVAGLAPYRWYFVDMLLAIAGIEGYGLEIAIQHDAPDAAFAASARDWLSSKLHLRIVTTGLIVPESFVLRPELFLGGIVPRSYADALSIGTVRASDLLGMLDTGGWQRVPDRLVREEIAATYAALIPALSERRAAIRQHIAWLTAVRLHLPRTGGCGVERSTSYAQGGNVRVVESERPREVTRPEYESGYESIREHATRQGDIFTAHTAMESSSTVSGATIWASIVARLSHTQTVRLWGPRRHDALQGETALLREIALSLTGVRRSDATGSARN